MKYTLLFLLLLVPTLNCMEQEQGSSDRSKAVRAGTAFGFSLILGGALLYRVLEQCTTTVATKTPSVVFCELPAAAGVINIPFCLYTGTTFVYFLIEWCKNRAATDASV